MTGKGGLLRLWPAIALTLAFVALQSFRLCVPVKNSLTQRPLTFAQITVTSDADSSMTYMGVQTGEKGASVQLPDHPAKYTIEVSFDTEKYGGDDKREFEPETVEYTVTDRMKTSDEVVLAPVYMKRRMAKRLDEVTVRPSKVKFYYKGDTLIYDADAFVLAEGSMLDALLDQMPGVILGSNGMIVCNDKVIQELLINGKDLFNSNNQLMLENLSAHTVKNVAVYDKAGRNSAIMGADAGDTKYVMDVRLKRQYSQGWIVNAEGGYGTEDRYLGRLFGMWFSDNASISTYAQSNNLSDASIPKKGDDSWTRDKMGSGVEQVNKGGINYFVEGPANKFQFKGDVSASANKTISKTDRIMMLYLAPNSVPTRFDWSNTTGRRWNFSTNHHFEASIANRASVTIDPSLSFGRNRGESTSVGATFSHKIDSINRAMVMDIYNLRPELLDSMLNRSVYLTYHKNHNLHYSVSASSMIKTKSTGLKNSVTIRFSANGSRNELDRYQSRLVEFGDFVKPGDPTLQHYKNHPNYSDHQKASAEFVQYLQGSDKRNRVSIQYSFANSRSVGTSELYSADMAVGHLLAPQLPGLCDNLPLDAAESYHSTLREQTHAVSPYYYSLFDFGSVNLYIDAKVTLNCLDRRYDHFRDGHHQRVSRDSKALDYSFSMSLAPTGFKDIGGGNQVAGGDSYGITFGSTSTPVSMSELINVISTSDPMYLYFGNPGLKDVRSNYLSIDGRVQGIQYHTFNVRYENVRRAISQGRIFNTTTGVTAYRPFNTDGNWNLSGYYSCQTPLGRAKLFTLSSQTNIHYVNSVDRLSGTVITAENDLLNITPPEQTVRSVKASEKLSIDYTLAQKHRFGIFGRVIYNFHHSADKVFADFSAWTCNYGATALLKLPKGWDVSTDLTLYTRRGYGDSRLNTTDLVWNARVSKSLLKGALVLVADGYDLLRQLSNVSYTVNAQARTEVVTNVIPSYVLFHAQWRFNRQPRR